MTGRDPVNSQLSCALASFRHNDIVHGIFNGFVLEHPNYLQGQVAF